MKHDVIPPGEVVLGRTLTASSTMGFGSHASRAVKGGLLTDGSDSHILTIASTGGGKTSGPVVTNARTYPGQLICLDPKGEVYRLSAEHRRKMGQTVHVLDLRDGSTHEGALNPLDIAKLLGTDTAAISRGLAVELVSRPADLTRDF